MITNKITVITSIIIIILVISIPTCIEVIKDHRDNLYRVTNGKIIGAAKKCYYEDVCLEEEIPLSYLYEKKYLEKVSDPISKEYYNEKSYVLRKDNVFEFIKVE